MWGVVKTVDKGTDFRDRFGPGAAGSGGVGTAIFARRGRRVLGLADILGFLGHNSSFGTVRRSIYVSDNGPEFTAHLVRRWLARLGVQTFYIEPGNPWENGYNESFNAKLRDEFLNGEIFYTLPEAVVLVEQWRRLYNTVRPHSACGGRPPAPRTTS